MNVKKEYGTELNRYLFFLTQNTDEYVKKYNEIETMILEELQPFSHNLESVKIKFIKQLFPNSEFPDAYYNPKEKTIYFVLPHIDFTWEITKNDDFEKDLIGCHTLREYVRSHVKHEYRHFIQHQFVIKNGVDDQKFFLYFRDKYNSDDGELYFKNPLEIDARNFSLDQAKESDLYRILDEYVSNSK